MRFLRATSGGRIHRRSHPSGRRQSHHGPRQSHQVALRRSRRCADRLGHHLPGRPVRQVLLMLWAEWLVGDAPVPAREFRSGGR